MTRGATPVRTCVGCGQRDAQQAMIRLRMSAGTILVEDGAGGTGRSAYLHSQRPCIQGLVKSKGLTRSLRATIGRELRLALTEALERRLAADPEGPARA